MNCPVKTTYRPLPVRNSVSSELALPSASEQERLFGSLELFVNLGDTMEEFRAFKQECPDFLPAGRFPGEGATDYRQKILTYRTSLRLLWQGEGGPANPRICATHLTYLLGLRSVVDTPYGGPLGLPGQEGKTGPVRTGTTYMPDWWSGNFLLFVARDFPRAIALLWRDRWRAKVCTHCNRYFVAAKPARLYCSNGCFGEAKRQRGLNWWRQHSKQWRQKGRRERSRQPTEFQHGGK